MLTAYVSVSNSRVIFVIEVFDVGRFLSSEANENEKRRLYASLYDFVSSTGSSKLESVSLG